MYASKNGCVFYKQKTAYEMRISDWSSDVCSSDLLHPGLEIALAAFEAAALDIAARTADARGIGGPQFSLRLERREFPDREDGEQHGADDRPRQESAPAAPFLPRWRRIRGRRPRGRRGRRRRRSGGRRPAR